MLFIKAVISKWKGASENTDSQFAFVGAGKKRGTDFPAQENSRVSRVAPPALNQESGS